MARASYVTSSARGWPGRDNQPVLLAIDVGNTQSHLGVFEGEDLAAHWRFATDAQETADELAVRVSTLLALRGMSPDEVDGSVVSSVVPQLTPQYADMCERYLAGACLIVGPGVKTGMPIRLDNPLELGADRLVNAVAAYERFGGAVRGRGLRHGDHLRRGLGRWRIPGRRDRARRRDLDGGAGEADGQAAADRARRAPGRARRRDRQDHSRQPSVRDRLRVRGRGGRDRAPRAARALRPRPDSSPRAAMLPRSSPSARRSTKSTTC